MMVRLSASLVVSVTLFTKALSRFVCASSRLMVRLLIVFVNLTIDYLSTTFAFSRFSIAVTVS